MKGCRPSTSFRLATGGPGSAGGAGGPRARSCWVSAVIISSASWTYASILYLHQTCCGPPRAAGFTNLPGSSGDGIDHD